MLRHLLAFAGHTFLEEEGLLIMVGRGYFLEVEDERGRAEGGRGFSWRETRVADGTTRE